MRIFEYIFVFCPSFNSESSSTEHAFKKSHDPLANMVNHCMMLNEISENSYNYIHVYA